MLELLIFKCACLFSQLVKWAAGLCCLMMLKWSFISPALETPVSSLLELWEAFPPDHNKKGSPDCGFSGAYVLHGAALGAGRKTLQLKE